MQDQFMFNDLISFSNLDSNIAITTLWTKKDKILEKLDTTKVALVGQLYSKNKGLNAVLRNCLLNKNIRYIIITGQDISNSGEALLNLVKNGIDENRNVIGSEKSEIEEEIPIEAVNTFRNNVEVLDCRNIVDYSQLNIIINALTQKPNYGEPEIFPEAKAKDPEKFPSEASGLRVVSKTVGQAWLEILKNITRFGTLKKSQYSDDQKELLNFVAVITDEDPDNPKWENFFDFTPEELKDYIPQITTKNKIEGVEYTYGQRLRDHNGIDQIQEITENLRKTNYSRRALACTWNVEVDVRNPKCPCLNLVQAIVQDGKLFLTAYIRSNDMFGAWPRNALGLRKLQKNIAQDLALELGSLTTVSCSAHLYSSNWKNAENIVDEFCTSKGYDQDPRGNFVISIAENKITVNHLDLDGKTLKTYEGPTAISLISCLANDNIISDLYHSLDLGHELYKAEVALRLGKLYVQDQALLF
ncbi:hypothetical protein HN681_01560 [archaeon]|jgi:thymidylate synthase|nr:hypothetical protein [archaeon]MBT3731259.1 hypothetical protein [archaeon]MBT4669987.1 hypothetical protein [archaeon]MBT5287811.1 hypothetical protein [archaeon]MBT7053253.1 hypothetical protein [archaeon]